MQPPEVRGRIRLRPTHINLTDLEDYLRRVKEDRTDYSVVQLETDGVLFHQRKYLLQISQQSLKKRAHLKSAFLMTKTGLFNVLFVISTLKSVY